MFPLSAGILCVLTQDSVLSAASLDAGRSEVVKIGVDFKDTLNPASFDVR